MRNLKPTKAKLPDNEIIIGGNVDPKFRNNTLKKTAEEVEKYLESKSKK